MAADRQEVGSTWGSRSGERCRIGPRSEANPETGKERVPRGTLFFYAAMTRIASTALESATAPPISPAVPIKSGVVVPGLGTRPGRLLDSAFFPHPFNHLEVAMNIKPLFDRVVIKRMEEEKMSAGGIVIPDSATEKPIKGEVVAVGEGKTLDNGSLRAPKVKVGDKVLFGKYSGTEVKLDGTDLLVVKEDDIFAILG